MRLFLFLSLVIANVGYSSISEDQWTEIHGSGVQTKEEKEVSNKRADRIAREIYEDKMVVLARKTDRSLAAIIDIGTRNLRLRGYKKEATELQSGYYKLTHFVEKTVLKGVRDIGDFEPLSKYLAVAYEVLEYKLGYQICYTLRLTDIKSLNYAIPVVFHPCKFGLSEFELHFVHDIKYRGLLPVVSYWTTVITCSIATFGAGYFFVCSPLAMGVEFAMDRWVAPALAPKIYNLVCN